MMASRSCASVQSGVSARGTPSRNSVLKRIRALDARLVARKRLGSKSAESIALSTPGMLEATEALELIQIDHTLADVMIVDSVYRHSIGRPTLDLSIDRLHGFTGPYQVMGLDGGIDNPFQLRAKSPIALLRTGQVGSLAAAPNMESH
jgi:hypothetical protein